MIAFEPASFRDASGRLFRLVLRTASAEAVANLQKARAVVLASVPVS